MSDYTCPSCGKEVGFGEAICPNCKADVTSLWEPSSGKKDTPKVVPGTGGMGGAASAGAASPFPPPSGGASPFPPPAGGSSPFPPPSGGASPFPPPAGGASPFPAPSGSGAKAPVAAPAAASPFPPPAGGASPFPPPAAGGTKAFPPVGDAAAPAAAKPTSGPNFDIPQNGGKLFFDTTQKVMRFGRDEIQGVATKALPDLNAYKNISRLRPNSEHFLIHIADEGGKKVFKIEDQHSTNGTYLGTTKLQGLPPQPLKEGDKIILPMEEFGKMVQLELFFHEK